MKIALERKWQDAWIGAYWAVETENYRRCPSYQAGVPGRDTAVYRRVDLWICVVPCFPIHIQWETYRP